LITQYAHVVVAPPFRSKKKRRWTWRVFWVVAALALLGVNAWNVLVGNRLNPFTKSYLLGVDEVEEQHQLSWLAYSDYTVGLWFTSRGTTGTEVDRPDGGAESTPAVRDVIGGDIAVEMTSESGDVIIPRKFLFAEPPKLRRSFDDFDRLTYILEPGFQGIQPKLFDRYTLRVTTIKTGNHSDPRGVELRVRGIDAGYHGLGWLIENVLVLAAIGFGAFILRLILKARG
jgi:hypothetical protein